VVISRLHFFTGCVAAGFGLVITGCGFEIPISPPVPTIVIDHAAVQATTSLVTIVPEEPPALPTVSPTLSASGPISAGLIQEYVDASYRVIAVARNPFAPYTLVVATERSRGLCGSPEEPVRCRIDDTCGATDTSPICYFFIEPSFPGAADPSTRFVARWPDSPAASALDAASLRFIDGRTVEFVARGLDAGSQIEQLWWLDLVTGAVAQQQLSDR
jgi:hypothetical protein